MKALAPNTLLQNRYLIVQLIGKGGMGEVYLGVDQRLGSAMAIKRTFFSDDETLTLAFEREAKTLARLRHPVLPKVSDHFTEDGVQYLVMEHISGDDLSKRLELTDQPFPLNWVLFWADQLLDALTYLHSHEPPIIHRDIKPQNLKLTSDNHIILLDFGLAKNSIGETRLSTSGSVVGYTPHYASMEQIRGTGTTARSDLYSLAATLYQLLTNTVPPDALSRADSFLNRLPDPIQPPHTLNQEVSSAISDVILKAMDLSAEQRYGTAREMQRALRDAYAQIQTSMTAQTEAFNVADIPQINKQASSTAPRVETNELSAQIANQIPQTGNLGDDFASSQNQTNNRPSAIPYDMPPMTGAKTEVFSNEFSSISAQSNSSAPKTYTPKEENIAPVTNNESFAAAESFASYEDFRESTADANQATAVNFVSVPKNEPASENFAPEPDYKAEEEPAVAQTPVTNSPPPKKSNSKVLAIVGGLAGLIIIGALAVAAVWYILKPSSTVTSVTPTPAPSVEPTTEPTAEATVEPTAEPTLQADTNTDSNTNSALTTASPETENTNNQNTAVATQNTPRPPTDRPSQQTPTPRPTIGPRAQATVKPQPQQQVKPTPKPTVDIRIIK